MTDETIRFLIEQKVSYINAVASVCMLWWVSSTLFCGTVLAAVWSRHKEIVENKLLRWLGWILLVFFSSIVIFGSLVIFYLWRVESEFNALVNSLRVDGTFFNTELEAFRWAMAAGTSSFILVWIAWFFLWRRLRKEAQKNLEEAQKSLEEAQKNLEEAQKNLEKIQS